MGFVKYFIYALYSLALFCASTVNASSHYDTRLIQQIIVNEANRQGVDPVLAMAIASVESNFNARAHSDAGAKGVMQIMPATAEKVFGVSRAKLYDAKVNVRIGIAFIKQLLNTYDQRLDIALSHYNGGSRVKNKHGSLRVIPATRNYVNKVLAARHQYEALVSELSDNKEIEASQQRTFASENRVNKQQAGEYSVTFAQPVVAHKTSVESTLSPRINQLRQLRMHNVMRNSKNTTSYPITAAPQRNTVAQSGTINVNGVNGAKGLVRIKGPRSMRVNQTSFFPHQQIENDVVTILENNRARLDYQLARTPTVRDKRQVAKPASLSEKQKKVLEWESIF